MIWENLTSPAHAGLDRKIPVILPVAAIEQHGHHLPLATDKLIVNHFCLQLEKEIPDQVLILPVMSVGCSEHHMDFSGSLTLQHNTFLSQAEDIMASVTHHGFRNIIIFNGHGGNLGIGQVIVEHFGNRHPQCRIVFATWWKIAGESLFSLNETGPGGVGHAGEFETSLMMVIAPDLVDTDQIMSRQNTENFAWASGDLLRGPRASFYKSMKAMTPNGVFGEPGGFSADKGLKINEMVVAGLKKVIFDLFSGA